MSKKSILIVSVSAFIIGLSGAFINPVISLGAFFLIAAVILFSLDFSASMYVLSGYLIIDYLLRSILDLSVMASLWDEFFLLGCVILIIIKWIVSKKELKTSLSPVHVPLLLFIAVNLFLLIVNSPYKEIGIEGVRAIVQHTLWFFIIFILIKDKLQVKRVIFFITLTSLFIALYGVFQYITGVEMPASWADMAEGDIRTRAFSIMGNPNALGSVMALTSMLALSMVFISKNFLQRIFFFGSFGIMALCLVVTLSRGAWIGFGIAILIFVLMYDKRYVLPLIALGILVMAFIPTIADRMIYMLSPQYIMSSLTAGRLYRWEIGWDMLMRNPLFGVGPGHFGGAVSMRYTYYLGDVFYMDNYYLKTAVEIGITGLISFLVLLYASMSAIFKGHFNTEGYEEKTLLTGFFTGTLGVIVHALFENVFEVPGLTVLFWVSIGLAMVLLYKNQESHAERSIS